ncbi:MAG TPA: hypothetical protein VJV78_05695 [Polyangiales bacterium]|nr:hypothetical protein [Polyangiales bacterium]
MINPQLKELLLQSLTHERGGVLVYKTALECVANADLRDEWKKYLAQTTRHVELLTTACQHLGIDPGEVTPTCQIVHNLGKSLVVAMKTAATANNPIAAELVACDCVLLAETKDHADWELIGRCVKEMGGEVADALKAAYEEIEEQEDEHLYHSQGYGRELWLKSLGLRAELPPPEEKKDVKSASEAERARHESEKV